MANMLEGRDFFCSWSGGKDSCLALHKAIKSGGRPRLLLTMLREDGQRSRSHGLPVAVLEEQASALGLELVTRPASWEGYEAEFKAALRGIRANGIEEGVFGDIDLEEHRLWTVRVSESEGLHAHHPLWKGARRELLEEFIGAGFKATIVSVKDEVLDRRYLGRVLTLDLIDELEAEGIDASGEGGEHHTVVTDGPIFSRSIKLVIGSHEFHDGYWFLEVRPEQTSSHESR